MLTSLPALDAAQSQDVLFIREELLHLMEWLLATNGELAPGFGTCQDFADGPLRQAQDVVPKDSLPNVVLDELLFDLACDLCCIHILTLGRAPCALWAAGRWCCAVGIRAGTGLPRGSRCQCQWRVVGVAEILQRFGVERVHELALQQWAQCHLTRQGEGGTVEVQRRWESMSAISAASGGWLWGRASRVWACSWATQEWRRGGRGRDRVGRGGDVWRGLFFHFLAGWPYKKGQTKCIMGELTKKGSDKRQSVLFFGIYLMYKREKIKNLF